MLDMECLVDFMGKRILPLEGELVGVNCSYRKEHLVRVPKDVFDKNVRKGFWSYGQYAFGQVKDEFLNKEFESGSYISENGFVYCCRECYARANDD